RGPVSEAQLDLVDLLLDDGGRVERALVHGPHRQTAAARLVAGERRLVGEEHRGALLCEPVRRRRPGRPSPDDDRVVVLHRPKATRRRTAGGVPERPKGTGCKPVGSAYGGSNPPAPTPAKDANPAPQSKSRTRSIARSRSGFRRYTCVVLTLR